jgi:hypothetical protein
MKKKNGTAPKQPQYIIFLSVYNIFFHVDFCTQYRAYVWVLFNI